MPETVKSDNRKELQGLLRSMQSLLEEGNFHPGLMSWNMLYMREVKELLSFFGVKEEK